MRRGAGDKANLERFFFDLIAGSEGHGASGEESGGKQNEENGGCGSAIRRGCEQSVEILPSKDAEV